MSQFLNQWSEAAYTSAGFFWMALWAFILGYIISSAVQVFVTEKRMQKLMGDAKSKSMLLGTFFGFISSSCSFAALATTKSLFSKGASFSSAIAFLLASTNLVIELGIVIGIFLGWQFIVGEYIGGILLILICWLLIRIVNPKKLIKKARNQASQSKPESDEHIQPLKKIILSEEHWIKVGKQYIMEWKMVWKDVTIGFTIAGIVATFLPDSFFQSLFINSGSSKNSYDFLTLLEHVIVGPVAAFLTFIGSMGNIPLAALLYGKGVSFAGIMAFIFSDLLVFPVVRINAKYYGWKMALLILSMLFIAIIISSLVLHYTFDSINILPHAMNQSIVDRKFFKLDYGFYLNISFLILTAVLVYLAIGKKLKVNYHKEMAPKSMGIENSLKWIAFVCYGWLLTGIILNIIM